MILFSVGQFLKNVNASFPNLFKIQRQISHGSSKENEAIDMLKKNYERISFTNG